MNTPPTPVPSSSRLARWSLAAFVLMFLASRILVLLIMSRRAPDLFLYFGQTHVHHLNYGIFLLTAVGAWLLFAPPGFTGRPRDIAALIYGIGLALTFDEFGMWLHLGGSYWQRASYDAVVVVLSVLGLLAFAPRWKRLRSQHFAVGAAVLLAVTGFSMLLMKSLDHADEKLEPRLLEMERTGPA